MSGISGINVNELFTTGMDSIAKKGEDLQARMNDVQSDGKVTPEEMMAIQYEMGLYNALMESLSTVTKSLTDSMKSIAQRAN